MPARFLVNLRPLTTSAAFLAGCRPRGFLAPPTYLTSSTREFARTGRGNKQLLVDNGRFDDIARIAGAYSNGVQSILMDALPPSQQRGNTGRRLDPQHRSALDVVLLGLVQDSRKTAPGLTLDEQLALRPTGVVGFENIAAATMLRTGIDLDLLPAGRRRLRRWNEEVARNAFLEVESRTGQTNLVLREPTGPQPSPYTRYYPVMSALDYDTAFDAGQVLSTSGIGFGAIGFGAFMADDAYTTRYKRAGRWRTLASPMPQRYLRTALVARGFFDGYAASGSQHPDGFHFLGLGAPIMLGLAALAGYGVGFLSFDATSPIRDATQGTMYFRDPAPLSIRTRRMALNLTDREGYRWPCWCPFCTDYVAQHPFDLAAAKQWRKNNPDRPLVAADLRASSPLGEALPLLAEPSGGQARREIDLARIGHNHWTLERLIDGINRHAQTRDHLSAWVGSLVSRYVASTNSPGFGRAVQSSFDLIRD